MPDLLEEAKRLSETLWPEWDPTRIREVLAELVERVEQAERENKRWKNAVTAELGHWNFGIGQINHFQMRVDAILAAQQRGVEGG